MKTRTKVIIATSLIVLMAGITIVGTSFANRREYRSDAGPMPFEERHGRWFDRGRHHGHHGWQRRGEHLFDSFDSNSDGKLTQAEVDQVRRDRFTKFDTDTDGKLTLQEYQALWLDAMRRYMVDRFQGLDDDGNAIVTTEEFVTPFEKVVRHMDRNNDGELTLDELRQR
jgi:Ca2+-binding EF-hand superfamily protein